MGRPVVWAVGRAIQLQVMQRCTDLGDALAEVDVLLQEDPLDPDGSRVVAVLELVEKWIGNAEIADVGEELAKAEEAVAATADFFDSQRDAGELDHVLVLQGTGARTQGLHGPMG